MGIADYLPDVAGFLGLGKVIFYLVVFTGIIIIVGIGLFFLLRHLKFNKHIVILEDVEGSDNLEPVGKDKGMLVKVAKSGMEVLYLKKRKTYKGAYGKRMGKNRYYFAIGSDGYWYNVTLGSLAEGLKTVNIKPTPVNMRYQNEALQEIIKERYDKTSFWQKYGGMIAFTMLIVLFGIMSYLLLDKYAEIGNSVRSAVDAAAQVQIETKNIIAALDNLQSSGGVRPA